VSSQQILARSRSSLVIEPVSHFSLCCLASKPNKTGKMQSSIYCSKLVFTLLFLLINRFALGQGDKSRSWFKFEVREETEGEYSVELNVPSQNVQFKAHLSSESLEKFRVKATLNDPVPLNLTGMIQTNWLTSSPFDVKFANANLSMPELFAADFQTEYHPTGSPAFNTSTVNANVLINVPLWNLTAKYAGQLQLNETHCPHIHLHHSISTEPEVLLSFDSSVSDKCNSSFDSSLAKLHQRNITINLSSGAFPSVQLQLDQLFEYFADGGWEMMQAHSSIMDALVSARWSSDDSAQYMHFKRAVFSSKLLTWFPSFELDYNRDSLSKTAEVELCLRVPTPKRAKRSKDEL
jgi:hypothetical protein